MASNAMINPQDLRDHMPVVCSDGGQFATVDHMDGDSIKLTKDDQGQHHWIPMDWVTRVDQHVHVDRPGDQAMRDWSSTAPTSDMTSTGGAIPLGGSGMEGHEGSASSGS